MNHENLTKLAEYLLQETLRAGFNMYAYSAGEGEGEGRLPLNEPTECGAAGCAVGHGPYAGIPKLHSETWSEYSERVFGIWEEDINWDWCFSGFWYWHDNTPAGAAHRVLYLVEHGAPPENWKYSDYTTGWWYIVNIVGVGE